MKFLRNKEFKRKKSVTELETIVECHRTLVRSVHMPMKAETMHIQYKQINLYSIWLQIGFFLPLLFYIHDHAVIKHTKNSPLHIVIHAHSKSITKALQKCPCSVFNIDAEPVSALAESNDKKRKQQTNSF